MSNKHGGKRKGAGRKPTGPNARNIYKSIKVSQPVADYLKENGTGIIETLIRNSRKFKQWKKK